MSESPRRAVTYDNFIDGDWIPSASGKTFENRNPADAEDLIGVFQDSDSRDVDRAVTAAGRAFESWRLTPAPKRAEILLACGEVLKKRKEEFARDMTREMGKILAETRGDVQEAIDMAELAAGEGRRMFGDTTTSELRNKFAMSVRMPLGVCALITPWNFPIAIPSWKAFAALICGNTVVVKPASDTPLSTLNLARAFEEAGLPKGVFNVVTGSGSRVGNPLVEHAGVVAVSFTGSTEIGREISKSCAPAFKRLTLEMGGKNAIMVMDDARLDLALEGAVWGGFGTAGQRCTAASRVIVHRKVYDEFVDRFVARVAKLRVGPGLDESTEMGPVVNRAQVEKYEEYIGIGKSEGARLATGGARLTDDRLARGHFVEPAVFADVRRDMRVATEEIFGPIVSVIPCESFEDALAINNSVRYGLSSAIYTQDVNRAFAAMRDVDTGICYVNAPTIGAETHLPFGGNKETGNGHREAGRQFIDFFTEWRACYVDFSGKLQRAQIDTE